jgi:hypothetical protein
MGLNQCPLSRLRERGKSEKTATILDLWGAPKLFFALVNCTWPSKADNGAVDLLLQAIQKELVMSRKLSIFVALLCLSAVPVLALDLSSNLPKETVQLKSAGPLAFGPDGILFVGDSSAATIHAIATDDTSGNPEDVTINLKGLGQKIAAALGTQPAEIMINDLAVNPLSGNAYLSVTRGRGPDGSGLILRVNGAGHISEVLLKNTGHAQASLENAPPESARGRRNRPLRPLSITDLAYLDGKVLVAGLSTEEFASTLRSIPFPFESNATDSGTGIKIFHGAHGRFETNSPVQTFTTMEINKEPYLLAAYTCTPLVRIPLSDLVPGAQVDGTTVAELGNRNKPLDMVVYERGGEQFILMANSSRGMMKIKTNGIERSDGIVEKIGGTAGQSYDSLEQLEGVVQLDRLNDNHVLLVVKAEDESLSLKTVALP